MSLSNTFIILTASVQPKDPEWAVDPISVGLRFDQYCNALSYYAKFADVIFVENTDFNYDWNKRFDGVFALYKHQLHVVKIPYYDGPNPKFVGEYQCIRAGIKKIYELTNRLDTVFFKVTGRVIVPNFDTLMSQYYLPRDYGTLITHSLWCYESKVNISTWLFAGHTGLMDAYKLFYGDTIQGDILSLSMENYLWTDCINRGVQIKKFNPDQLDPILVPYYQGLYYDWIQNVAIKSWKSNTIIPIIKEPFSY